MRDMIETLKTKEKKQKLKQVQPARSTPSTAASVPASRPPAPAPSSRRPLPKKSSSKKNGATNGRRLLDADALLSFEEKKELSETIQNLDDAALEEVIQIIRDGVPEIGDVSLFIHHRVSFLRCRVLYSFFKQSTDEIELEIDALPPSVLRALWNTVIKPKQAPAPQAKPFKPGRNQSGTGGKQRKSMDEAVEAEKMRALEARISMFDQAVSGTAGATNGAVNGAGSVTTVHPAANDADSTDSESDSASSASD
jgi:bromodomain-containing factor 1